MNTRHDAVRLISNAPFSSKNKPRLCDFTQGITGVYASLVFHEGVQRERLPAKIFKSLQDTIKRGEKLDPAIADAVATAMRDWAVEHGATHYSHWFQPLTGSTAEKHDSFITPHGHSVLARFSGSELIRGESDASSFPSGGLRATFEARGYTAWDPSSPAFILENENGATLVIPTMFLSWGGESLDRKTPMLRSLEALNTHALRVLRAMGNTTATRVECTLGVEQEYFLVDIRLAMLRPDLMITGRTLFGASPPKGQELDDNYFGAIPERVLTFMTELEYELVRLGIPIKTRHNEAAPGQYELAPTFETMNLALDHQMLTMQLLQQIAQRHGFMCLLHEKPFKGVNGSGKHNNWSIGTDTGENLLEPGETDAQHLQFLVFCSALCRAVYRHASLIRMAVASAGNDHRLGAAEAPPAIMSIHLGYDLERYYHELFGLKDKKPAKKESIDLRLPMFPRLDRHIGDRNRTSPVAFTGNKFEFRACGSSQNASGMATIINTCVAESLDFIATQLETRLAKPAKGKDKPDFTQVVLDLLEELATEFAPIIYNGDNYSQEWKIKAEKRGLPNITSSADCLEVLTREDSVRLFETYGVFSETELRAHQEIMAESYCTTILIEAKTALRMAQTQILPAVMKYKAQLAPALTVCTSLQKQMGEELDRKIDLLIQAIDELGKLLYIIEPRDKRLNAQRGEKADQEKEDHEEKRKKFLTKAKAYDTMFNRGAMHALRMIVDYLEQMVDDACWPLPTYSELLFMR